MSESESVPTSENQPSNDAAMDTNESESTSDVVPSAVASSSTSLDELMADGVDETAIDANQEQTEQQVEGEAEGETAVQEDDNAAKGDAAGDAGSDDEGGATDGLSKLTADADPALVESLRAHLKVILANFDVNQFGVTGVKAIMSQLKEVAGKKVIKKHKALAKALAKQAAQALLDEVQSAAASAPGEEEEEVVEEEEEDFRPPIGDEEDEEEEPAPKKSKKRLRKASSDGDDDEDYSEEKRSKKKSKSSSSSSKPKKSSTSALLSIPTPKNSFIIFQQAERPKMREEHPDANSSEIQKLISEKWAELDSDSKNEYEQIARKQKEMYREVLLKLKQEDPEAYEAHLKASKKNEEALLRDPSSKKKKKDRSASGGHSDYSDDGGDDGQDPESAKELSYFDAIVKDLKVRRQTRSELTPEQQKEAADLFIQRMDEAVTLDMELSSRGKPAFTRLEMLPDVQAQVSKPRTAELLLDAGILKVFKKWLNPEHDGSLPNVKLRTVIYQLLSQLNITEANLENSHGLGKTVMRLWKDPEETLSNKRMLETLIQKWMRPMLGLSTDYNKLSELDEERGREILTRKILLDQQKGPANYNPKRTMVPQPARFDYAIRPQAHRDHEDEAEEAREAKSAKRNEPVSRKEELSKKLDKMKKGANMMAKPRFKVDITGRASNL